MNSQKKLNLLISNAMSSIVASYNLERYRVCEREPIPARFSIDAHTSAHATAHAYAHARIP